ncbi:MAG TPA: 50S ribosomal protein L29 [Candidatus Paceibacterota bacterium]
MKTKDIKKNIKGKSATELNDLLAQKKVALRDFRFGLAGSKSRNIKEGRGLKRDIARVKTELRSKK